MLTCMYTNTTYTNLQKYITISLSLIIINIDILALIKEAFTFGGAVSKKKIF